MSVFLSAWRAFLASGTASVFGMAGFGAIAVVGGALAWKGKGWKTILAAVLPMCVVLLSVTGFYGYHLSVEHQEAMAKLHACQHSISLKRVWGC